MTGGSPAIMAVSSCPSFTPNGIASCTAEFIAHAMQSKQGAELNEIKSVFVGRELFGVPVGEHHKVTDSVFHYRAKEKPMRRKARISTRLIGSIRFMCVLYSARDVDASLFCAFPQAGLDTEPNPSQDHLYVFPGLRLRIQDHLVDGFVKVGVALFNLLLAHVCSIPEKGVRVKPFSRFFHRSLATTEPNPLRTSSECRQGERGTERSSEASSCV